MALTREDAQALDAQDPLAPFRDRFVINDEHRLYLDGNSLGRLPKGTRDRLHRIVEQWGEELVGGWHDWIGAPTRTGDAAGGGAVGGWHDLTGPPPPTGDALAEVIGADAGTVLVTDSVTVNLFKLVNAI